MIQGLFLLFVALLLIYSEFYLPGGIMGTAGTLFIVVSIFVFSEASDSILPVLLFTVAAFVGVALTIKLALSRIRAHGGEQTIFLASDQEGYRAPVYEKELIGSQGIVDTSMSPSGHILIGGKRYQAVSQTGYLEKGLSVRVVGGKSADLIVKEEKQEEVT
jgi:membrane-bound ClpP family serine protease